MKAVAAICVVCVSALAIIEPGRGESPTTAPVAVTGTAQPGDWFAFLHGTVDPGGLETRAWFEWGRTPALGSSTSAVLLQPGSPVEVQANIYDLESFTTYYFRMTAANASGTGFGDIVPFSTLDTVPPPPKSCHVPSVVGQKLTTARRSIKRAGCRVGPMRFVRSRRKNGIVISQAPKGGTVRHFHARVRLVVSRGRPA